MATSGCIFFSRSAASWIAIASSMAESPSRSTLSAATCRKAEEIQRDLLERFDALVARAQKEGWTVARTRAELSERRRKVTRDGPPDGSLPCCERTGKGQNCMVVHLDRMRDPAVGTDSIAELLAELLALVREIETAHPDVGATKRAEPAEKAPEPPPASGP